MVWKDKDLIKTRPFSSAQKDTAIGLQIAISRVSVANPTNNTETFKKIQRIFR